MSHHPIDQVTREYIQATRMGVSIRTPLENVTHFHSEDKCVTAVTKTNGEFTLNIPLWEIRGTIRDLVTYPHRSYLVMNHALKGAKMFKPEGSVQYVFEVMTTARFGTHVGVRGNIIKVARREGSRVRAIWVKANA